MERYLLQMFSFGRRKQAAAVALEAAGVPADACGSQRGTRSLVSFAGSTTLKVDATDPRWAGRAMPGLLGAAKASDLVLLTRLLDRLESRELIARDRDAADRRVVNVRIADAGVALLETADKPVFEWTSAQFPGFDPPRLRSLIEMLEQARAELDCR